MKKYLVKPVMNGKPFGTLYATNSAVACRYLVSKLANQGYGVSVRSGDKTVLFQTDYDHDGRRARA